MKLEMDRVRCAELIVSTLTRRGKGIAHSPIRVITEVFDKEGNKIAEHDPSPEHFQAMDMVVFARFIRNVEGEIMSKHVDEWLDTIK